MAAGSDGVLHHPPARQIRVRHQECHRRRLVVHIPELIGLNCMRGRENLGNYSVNPLLLVICGERKLTSQ